MGNNINLAQVYTNFIDEALTASSKTKWMEDNAIDIDYDGGSSVRISTLNVSGMGSYDKTGASGNYYPTGTISNVWNTYNFTQDRGVEFQLDRVDPNDTNYLATVENVLKTFTNTQVIKELDTYRFNKIYKLLSTSGLTSTHLKSNVTLSAANILTELNNAIFCVRKDSEDATDYVCFMALSDVQFLRSAASDTMNSVSYGNSITVNGQSFDDVIYFNEMPIITVPDSRLQTSVTINDGKTAGQTNGGITVDSTSKLINFMIIGSNTPIAVMKLDEMKTFSPEFNQKGSGTLIQGRMLHDLWIPSKQFETIYACTK